MWETGRERRKEERRERDRGGEDRRSFVSSPSLSSKRRYLPPKCERRVLLTLRDQAPVDGAWLDGGDQSEEEAAVGQGGVPVCGYVCVRGRAVRVLLFGEGKRLQPSLCRVTSPPSVPSYRTETRRKGGGRGRLPRPRRGHWRLGGPWRPPRPRPPPP